MVGIFLLIRTAGIRTQRFNNKSLSAIGDLNIDTGQRAVRLGAFWSIPMPQAVGSTRWQLIKEVAHGRS